MLMAKVYPSDFYPTTEEIHSWLNEIYKFNLGRHPSKEEIRLVHCAYEKGIRNAWKEAKTSKYDLEDLLSRKVIDAVKEIKIPTTALLTREKYDTYLEYEDIVEIMNVVIQTLNS